MVRAWHRRAAAARALGPSRSGIGHPASVLDIWSAQASGTGTVSLVWPGDKGSLTLVVMNVDGTADVAAHVSVDASPPWLGWVSAVLLVGAAVGMLLSLTTLYAGLRDPDPPADS
jgi:hypothetical protein